MFKIKYVPSTAHWIMPPIIIGVLIILIAGLTIQRIMKCKQENKPFFAFKGYHFFIEDYDKLCFWGTLVLFVMYIFLMNLIGFLAASILCIFLYNVLFSDVKNLHAITTAIHEKTFIKSNTFRSLATSLIVSVIFSVIIWYLFGQVFNITLP